MSKIPRIAIDSVIAIITAQAVGIATVQSTALTDDSTDPCRSYQPGDINRAAERLGRDLHDQAVYHIYPADQPMVDQSGNAGNNAGTVSRASNVPLSAGTVDPVESNPVATSPQSLDEASYQALRDRYRNNPSPTAGSWGTDRNNYQDAGGPL